MIGIFDSGLGGLSVLAAIARALPRADLAYLADTAHVPYGNKPDAFIRGRVAAIGDYLVAQGCRVLVVACNTATAAAVGALREKHPALPIVGVEPGVKPAAASSRSRRIAVLATESTAKSERLARLIAEHAQGVAVQVEPCPGWATRVETLHPDGPEFAAEVAARIAPLLAAGADRLVLGCTHYSFLTPILVPLVAGRAELVDVADAVARQCLRLAGPAGEGHGRLTLHATAQPERLRAALPALGLGWLGERAQGQPVLARI
ncbi:MAG: glutamate racemase [Rhodocyclales bacterium]|nr:glutamate racemase [Rhodocyclales bacterium]